MTTQNSKLEGLLLSKHSFAERHLIGTLLLRSGKLARVSFYGGRGGGKQKKSSMLELGFMLKVEVGRKSSQSDIYPAKEWELIWHHDQIRYHHQTFSMLCFFLELFTHLSQDDLMMIGDDQEETSGLFRVLSNTVFHLNRLDSKDGHHQALFCTGMAKLFLELGIFPRVDECVLTEKKLTMTGPICLLTQHGGFAFQDSLDSTQPDQRSLWWFLVETQKKSFSELMDYFREKNLQIHPHLLIDYFCYHFQVEKKQLRSLATLSF